MNEETLKKAIELNKEIKDRQILIDMWKSSNRYGEDLSMELLKTDGKGSYYVQFKWFLPFDEAKKMALAKLNKELDELKKEFEKL